MAANNLIERLCSPGEQTIHMIITVSTCEDCFPGPLTFSQLLLESPPADIPVKQYSPGTLPRYNFVEDSLT